MTVDLGWMGHGSRPERLPARERAWEFAAKYESRVALGLVMGFGLLFSALALARHRAFHSTALDLAVFDQVIWNTLHGRFMESTLSLGQCVPHSFFGDHFSPALLLLVPFYAIFSGPETLLIVQSAALAAGAWPLYLLARTFLHRSEERLLWVLAYLLSAPLAFIALYDFHEVSLCIAPLGFAVYFLATSRTRRFLLCLFATFLIKEEFALIGIGFGLALAVRRQWRLAAFVTLVSVLVFVITLKIVIPAFAGTTYQYLGRYKSLGDSELEIARTLLLDPLRVLRVLVQGEVGSKLAFVLSLFGVGFGVAFRSRWAVIPALVPVGYLMLSDYGGEHTLHNQYAAPLIPLALGATIIGMATLTDRVRRRLSLAALISVVFFAVGFGGLPFTPDFAEAVLRGPVDRAPDPSPILQREPRYAAFLTALRAMPPDAAVASQDYLTTQLAQRRYSYYFNGLDACNAQYVILDAADPHVNRDLAAHRREVAQIEALGFEEIARGEGLSLLRRR